MKDEDADREARIEALKRQAAAAAGGTMMAHECEEIPHDVREQFWQQIVDFESRGTTDLLTELKRAGIHVPDPADLDDDAIHDRLWAVIHALAEMNVFLYQTNHLSDRELYTRLYGDLLPEEMPALIPDDRSAWHIDVFGSGSFEEIQQYLKYYLRASERQHRGNTFPGEPIAPHETPPYDRDRLLPTYG